MPATRAQSTKQTNHPSVNRPSVGIFLWLVVNVYVVSIIGLLGSILLPKGATS